MQRLSPDAAAPDYFPGGRYPLVGSDRAADAASSVLAGFRERAEAIVHVLHSWDEPDAAYLKPGTAGFVHDDRVAPAADACAAPDLEYAGVHVPGEQVHAASVAALADGVCRGGGRNLARGQVDHPSTTRASAALGGYPLGDRKSHTRVAGWS